MWNKVKEQIISFLKSRTKPITLITDLLLVILVVSLLIPATRSRILGGVSVVRTWFTASPAVKEGGRQLTEADWQWALTGESGKQGVFGDFRGQVIFLNQWATWCPPCRAEMASIEKLYRHVGDRVKFVLLTSEDPGKVRDYLREEGYTFPVYFGSARGTSLDTRTIPATTVIARDGSVVMQKGGALNWNAVRFRKLLAELSTL